jgi:hypothetical protein
MRKLLTFIVLAFVGLSFLTASPALAGNKHHKAAHAIHKHLHRHQHLKHHNK